jgi:amino acid transporter
VFALADGPARWAFLVVVFGALATLNVLGVTLGARAIAVLATLKLTPLFALAIVGLCALPFVETHPLTLALPAATPLGAAMLMAIFAYSGMETALAPSGEVKDPSRTVPRATIAAILVVVFLYVSLQVVASTLLGPALPTSLAPLADAAERLWPPALVLLLATAGVSMLGFLQGTLLGSPRVVYALGRDGFLPRPFGAVSAKYRTPYVAILFHAAVACALAIGGDFAGLVLISSGANCLLYAVACAAAWQLERSDVRGPGAPFRLPAGPLLPIVGVLSMIAVLTSLTRTEWIAIAIAVGGLILLFGVARAMRHDAQ